MSRDIVLHVVAKKSSRDLQLLAEEFKKVEAEAEATGKSFQKNTTFSRYFDDQIKKTKTSLQGLRTEFAKTGDISLAGQIGGTERNLKSLEKLRSSLKTDLEKLGEDGGFTLMKGLQYGAAAAAPVVLPAISGALLGAGGLGVIAAGVVGQLSSPQVKTALTQFKDDAGGIFKDVTSPFGPVLVQGLSDADVAVRKLSPELSAMFTKAAPSATKFIDGITGFVTGGLPGFNRGLDGALLIVDELSNDLPGLGRSFGDAFAAAATGAQGDALALRDLLSLTEKLIVAGGTLAGTSGREYEQLRSIATLKFDDSTLSAHNLQETFNALTTAGIAPVLEHLLGLGQKSKDAKPPVDALADALDKLKPPAKSVADALSEVNTQLAQSISLALAADQASQGQQQAEFDLAAAIKENGKHWDDNSQAALNNQTALTGAIAKAEAKRQADIANGLSAIEATQAYDDEVNKLLGIAGAAGDSKTALDRLKGTYEIDINEIHKTIYQQMTAEEFAKHPHGLAVGGPVAANRPYLVGERGPEMFVSGTPGYIVPTDKLRNIVEPPPFLPPRGGARTSQHPGGMSVGVVGSDSLAASFVAGLLRTGAIRLLVRPDGTVSASGG